MNKRKLLTLSLALIMIVACVFTLAACGGQDDTNKGDKNTPTETTYTVTFNAKGGSAVANLSVSNGQKITAPAAPTRDGYNFSGWYKEDTCVNVWNFNTDTVSADTTLYAKWAANVGVTSIEITSEGKKVFKAGQNFASDGLAVKINYDDSTDRTLTAAEYTVDSAQYKGATEGTYTIIVKLKSDETKTASYTVSVIVPKTMAFKSDSAPATAFLLGDIIDYSGIKAEFIYSDGVTKEDISASRLSMSTVGDVLNFGEQSLKTKVEVIANVAYGGKQISASYDITIYKPEFVIPNNIIINTEAMKTTFAKGEAFSSAGLVVKKTADAFGQRDITMVESEYTVNSEAFDGNKPGQYTIRVSSTRVPTKYKEFSVNVIDLSGATVTALEIKQSSKQYTEFIIKEDFSYAGLLVQKVMSNGMKIDMAESEYTVDSSSYVNASAGNYTITVKAVEDNNIKTSYQVTVKAIPFAGKYYSKSVMAPTKGTIIEYVFKVGEDAQIYAYDNDFAVEGQKYSLIREGDVYTVNGYVFDPVAKTLTAPVSSGKQEVMYKQGDNDYLITLASDATFALYTRFLAINGKISQDDLDAVNALLMMDLYLEETFTTPVTADTVFTKDTALYCKEKPVDYTGKPFIGYFITVDGNIYFQLQANGKANMEGMELPYTAVESANGYNITLMGMDMEFNATTKAMLLTPTEGTPTELKLADSAVYAFITITSADTELKERYGKAYFIMKGDKIPLITLNGYTFQKFVSSDYDGKPINADRTITITAVTEYSNLFNNDKAKFGTFAGSVTLNRDYTVVLSDGEISTNGVYSVTDLTAQSLSINITAGGATVAATVSNKDSWKKMINVESGAFAGEYGEPYTYKGAPFLGRFTNGEKYVYIQEYGTVEIGLTAGEVQSGDVESVVYADGNFTVTFKLFVVSDYVTKVLQYNTADEAVTFETVVYAGATYHGEAFLGKYVYRDKYLIIREDGAVEGSEGFAGTVNTVDYSVASKITITTDTGKVLVFDVTAKTITQDAEVYKTAHDNKYEDATFVNVEYIRTEGDIKFSFTFTTSGLIYSENYVLFGEIISVNGSNIIAEKYDNGEVTFVLGEKNKTLTLAGVVYALPCCWKEAVAGNLYSANGEANIDFQQSGSVNLVTIGEITHKITSCVTTETGLTITILFDDGSGMTPEVRTLIYNKSAETITYQEVVYSRI